MPDVDVAGFTSVGIRRGLERRPYGHREDKEEAGGQNVGDGARRVEWRRRSDDDVGVAIGSCVGNDVLRGLGLFGRLGFHGSGRRTAVQPMVQGRYRTLLYHHYHHSAWDVFFVTLSSQCPQASILVLTAG